MFFGSIVTTLRATLTKLSVSTLLLKDPQYSSDNYVLKEYHGTCHQVYAQQYSEDHMVLEIEFRDFRHTYILSL